MSDPLRALDQAYEDLSALARALDEDRSWAPTRCLGWTARDLLQHLLSDAQRVLVALATPSAGPTDVDAVSYWIGAPSAPDALSVGIRNTRAMASLWSLPRLVETYVETAAAARTLARRTPLDEVVSTQGHTLTVEDLVRTAVTEAAIHHLDLQVEPGPREAPLDVTLATLDGLLGRSTPAEWSTRDWVLAAAGRTPLSAAEREWLASDADRLPLLR